MNLLTSYEIKTIHSPKPPNSRIDLLYHKRFDEAAARVALRELGHSKAMAGFILQRVVAEGSYPVFLGSCVECCEIVLQAIINHNFAMFVSWLDAPAPLPEGGAQ